MTHLVSHSRRLRDTPFTPGVEASGVTGYTVYNRMLLPTIFESIEADYRHLKSHVQVWDVSVERQIELNGPDALKLMQKLTPRDLSRMQSDQCYYIPVVDENGGMLNDPVAIKHDDTRWWISIADSDLLLWVKGLAVGAGFDVRVFEPDVSPLAVQGPKSDALMEKVFGSVVHDIRFFRQKRLAFGNSSFIVSRSGYSKQGGFEIYVEGSENGMPLWDALFSAGKDLDVRPGCPNLIERVEGGLLSYGNDMTRDNSPFECGLGRFCKPAEGSDFIGRNALEAEAGTGPSRQVRAVSIAGDPIRPPRNAWPLIKGDQKVGQITSAAWSPDFGTNVSIAMVDKDHWEAGTELMVETPEGPRDAVVQEQFWK
ncbi:MAG: dimethylsulfoniopropionate demethylase [Silicimonas sp.]|nr:dimethylsulfoniopropionate demethylase [Silicimonas sp.]